MPGRDRTGPMGEGPRTGRQMGLCKAGRQGQAENAPGAGFNMNRGFRGQGGRGPGRGCRGRGIRGRGRALGPNQ
ncbi:MAG: DUF5320 domain-containing protein [Desulfonatronovibrionaceae bacterium]